MNPPSTQPQWLSPERKLSGTTRVFLAFATGTLFALLPMYYFYTGRTAPLTASAGSPALPAAADSQSGPGAPVSTPSAERFAARMTYELSQAPAEPVKISPPAPRAPAADDIAAQRNSLPPTSDVVASRVQHARPIIASPPEPRDTTREMEKEARRAEYREPQARQTQPAPDAVQPRVIDGRDVLLPAKPPAVATRAIGPSPVAPRAEPEAGVRGAERGNAQASSPGGKSAETPALATGAVVAGVTPIGRAPEPQPKREPQPKAETAVAGPPDSVEGRLAATREWLAGAAQTTHTIQIMGTNSEEQLKSHLKSLSKLLDPRKIYAFRTLAQGRPAITVVYGAYADRQAALQALENLPAAVSANRPVLRTVNGIRAEQKQHGIKSDSS
jgi:septal ring-binding cell division protein DamX